MSAPDSAARRAGVVLDTHDGPRFISAKLARKVVLLGPVTSIAGLPPEVEGIALAEGSVITVVKLTSSATQQSEAVLCEVRGDLLALRAQILEAGLFHERPRGVMFHDTLALELDVAALHERLQSALWTEQARQRARRSLDSARARSSQIPAPFSSGRPPA